MRTVNRHRERALAVCLLLSVMPLSAAGDATDGPGVAALRSEIELLKQMLAGQQRQIDELRQSLAQQIPAPLAYTRGSVKSAVNRTATVRERTRNYFCRCV